jgi:hypothetical protein
VSLDHGKVAGVKPLVRQVDFYTIAIAQKTPNHAHESAYEISGLGGGLFHYFSPKKRPNSPPEGNSIYTTFFGIFLEIAICEIGSLW